jgi:NLI interacting factor-like phosphatase
VLGLGRCNKLCLVLDLDHTLVNSVRFGELAPDMTERLQQRMAKEAERLPEEQRSLFALDGIQMWTKLRPGVRAFLRAARDLFELWIHTNANRCVQRSWLWAGWLGSWDRDIRGPPSVAGGAFIKGMALWCLSATKLALKRLLLLRSLIRWVPVCTEGCWQTHTPTPIPTPLLLCNMQEVRSVHAGAWYSSEVVLVGIQDRTSCPLFGSHA